MAFENDHVLSISLNDVMIQPFNHMSCTMNKITHCERCLSVLSINTQTMIMLVFYETFTDNCSKERQCPELYHVCILLGRVSVAHEHAESIEKFEKV